MQLSKIAVIWAILTFALAILWTVALNMLQVSGIGPAASLVAPAIIAAVLSIYIYFVHLHWTLVYDDYVYLLTRGAKDSQSHKWSEFRECSLIRDSYGNNKVRLYVERDGRHFEIDSAVCGLNPVTLRDFIQTKINGRKVKGPMSHILYGLEREILRGRVRLVADMNEAFKFYQTSGEIFPLMARGSTRPKGFLLSRFVAVTLMPDYTVALYVHDVSGWGKSRIMGLVRIIEGLRDKKNIRWSWLLLLCDDEPPTEVAKLIENFENRTVGVGCIDASTGRLITSQNQLGRSLGREMRLHRLIRDLNRQSSIRVREPSLAFDSL